MRGNDMVEHVAAMVVSASALSIGCGILVNSAEQSFVRANTQKVFEDVWGNMHLNVPGFRHFRMRWSPYNKVRTVVSTVSRPWDVPPLLAEDRHGVKFRADGQVVDYAVENALLAERELGWGTSLDPAQQIAVSLPFLLWSIKYVTEGDDVADLVKPDIIKPGEEEAAREKARQAAERKTTDLNDFLDRVFRKRFGVRLRYVVNVFGYPEGVQEEIDERRMAAAMGASVKDTVEGAGFTTDFWGNIAQNLAKALNIGARAKIDEGKPHAA